MPVIGQSVIVETENGEPTGEITGHIIEGIHDDIPDIDPLLNEDDAFEIAAEMWGDELYDILDGTFEIILEIYVEDEENSPDVIPILAYHLSYMTIEDGSVSKPTFIIDANTGGTIHSWEGLTTRSPRRVEGTGPYEFNAIGGNLKIGKIRYGENMLPLSIWMEDGVCYLHNEKVTVVDASTSMDQSAGFNFPCEQGFNDTINGGYSPLADAVFFGTVGYDVFYEWLGVQPLKSKVVLLVHYGEMYENAFWDGQLQVCNFGDGASSFYPFVVLDVVAHEIGHGFTEQNSGLIYNGQSGGMNEAFSDIAGEAADAYMKEIDWLHNLAFKPENQAGRYFIDPTLDGYSLGHMDDYCQYVDVHLNSGLYNRVYYLLTTTPGWNARMSFQVFATANQLYWTPDSSFNDGACGTMQAARDLGFNDQDVLTAFNTVGIHPCGPRFEGMHIINTISGVHNETLYFHFDLEQDDTDLLRFETFAAWYYSGDYRIMIQIPSGDTISSRSSFENLNVLDPEIGRYTVTFECDDYFENVGLRALRASQVLEDSFIWVNRTASGSFSLPQDVIDAGQTIVIRLETANAESSDDLPNFALSHEAEVNIMEYTYQIWASPYYTPRNEV